MPLTQFQRDLCRLIADNRIARGEAYVAGGVALTEALRTARISRDLDLFHDTREALVQTFAADLRTLETGGYRVDVYIERPAYVEARVQKGDGSVVIQWTCDSAYRFFPLLKHPDLGLTLHPFDLATNKVLALVGRAEPRDWFDTIACHHALQPFGYLAWAACGKDPALSPAFILDEAARTTRYTQAELARLEFEGGEPNAAELANEWKAALVQAREIHALLPPSSAGRCVLNATMELYAGGAAGCARDIAAGQIIFHEGRIGGVWPRMIAD
jgi:hypothetical protein